ncbi:MAG: hypothetical protein SFV32_09965 [Opitutaceae bacterium]|nr:hypothetical protein [Opitutaceae bacterium]
MSTDNASSRRWLGIQRRVTGEDGETRWRWNFPRLAAILGVVAALTYLGGAVAGFLWLKNGRNARSLEFFDVLLLDVRKVKTSIARAHLEDARKSKERQEYQKAYVSYVSALRSDGNNGALRLEVAEFFTSVGSTKQALTVLEQGIQVEGPREEIGLRLLNLLQAQGKDARVIELVRGSFAKEAAGPKGVLFRRHEVEAVLAVEGAAAAKTLLEKHPQVASVDGGPLLVAKIHWAAGERQAAVETLRAAIAADVGSPTLFIFLGDYLDALGYAMDVEQVARQAVERFPTEPSARILLISALRGVNMTGTAAWRAEVEGYVRDFGDRSENLLVLAELGGKKGWVDFTRTVYAGSIASGRFAGMFGLCYSDALLRAGRVADARRVLDELAVQMGEEAMFAKYLRRRQVVAAAAAGATLAMREHARGLAVLLSGDSAALDSTRRFFLRLGLTEAASELAGGGGRGRVQSQVAQ